MVYLGHKWNNIKSVYNTTLFLLLISLKRLEVSFSNYVNRNHTIFSFVKIKICVRFITFYPTAKEGGLCFSSIISILFYVCMYTCLACPRA